MSGDVTCHPKECTAGNTKKYVPHHIASIAIGFLRIVTFHAT
jgi:hypothetical protein